MGRTFEIYKDWMERDGKEVKIDGLKYRLKVSTYRQRYPYACEMIDVHAVPVSRSSAKYRDVKRELGDDWSMDVLDSDIEVQAEIIRQVG